MGTLIQRIVRWARDTGETWALRLLQWVSVKLGRFTPRVQTRIVRAVQVAVEVHVKSLVDDVSTQAAALTYATFLSLLPLLLVGFSLAGTVIQSVGQSNWFQELIAGIPGLAEAGVDQLQHQLQTRADIGIIGLIGALWAASVLSSRAERALAQIFGVKRRNVVNRFRAVMITVVLGAVVIGGLVVGAVLQSFDLHGFVVIPAWIVVRAILLLVEFGYFLLLYKLLTPSKSLRWRDHLPGAVLMTLGFAVLKIDRRRARQPHGRALVLALRHDRRDLRPAADHPPRDVDLPVRRRTLVRDAAARARRCRRPGGAGWSDAD